MSHCLKKMFNATTQKSYDFWYYSSLLEEPYTDLLKYFSMLIYERDKNNIVELVEEDSEPKYTQQANSSKGVARHHNYLKK